MKVYILLGRASFRLRYEEWKRDRKKIQAIQAEAAAALEVEQLRSLYQAEGLIGPPEGTALQSNKPFAFKYLRLIIELLSRAIISAG